MNIVKQKRLELARLLKLYAEVQTNNGTLITEGELAVDSEVFVIDEEGNLVPAPTGTYETDAEIYNVENGIIKSIEKKDEVVSDEDAPVEDENMEDETTEEETAAEEVVEDVKDIVDEVVEEVVELPEQTEEDKDAKIAALEAKIAELQAIIDGYKAKETEPVADSIEDEEKKDKKFNKQTKDAVDRVTAGAKMIEYFKNKNNK